MLGLRPLLLVLATSVAADPLPAQKKKVEVCPWCKDDPALMQPAGIVSHGPIAIGPEGSQKILAELPAAQWIFLETAHLRWASALGPTRIDLKERERVEAELDRLRAVLPTVPEKPKQLDPWLRLHLFAMRGEEFYARFQALLRVTDADFPESRGAEGPYMGDGRFLGEKEKFEIVLHSTRSTHATFCTSFAGGAPTDALRWHFPGVHKLLLSIPCEDADLRQDRWLFPHVVHSLSHALFCAYKHFSYDPPMWLDEGLALCMEKEIEPRSTTNEGEEGGKRDARGPNDYREAAAKLAASGKGPRLPELFEIKEFAEMGDEEKVTAWAVVRFLLDEHPQPFASFLGTVKGQLDEQGYPTGRDLIGLQRKALQDLWAWNPLELDEAWRAWILR